MTKPIKFFIAILLIAIISSCADLRDVNLSAVKIGMSKAEVQVALRKKPENVVAAKHLTNPDEIVEILQYNGLHSFYLYFVNDKLEKWHEVRPDEGRPTI